MLQTTLITIDIYSIAKMFKPVEQRHKKVLIIGGGESLVGFDFEQTVDFDGAIITVNNVILHLPRADYWISTDLARRMEGLETTFNDCYYYAGYPTMPSPYENRKDIHFLEKVVQKDFRLQNDKSKVTGGVDSVYLGLNLAYHFEAEQICMLGVDCYGFGHWYDKNSPYNGYNNPNFEQDHMSKLPSKYQQSVRQFNKRNCFVVNGSEKSLIDCFSRVSPQEAYNLIR